MDLDSVSEIEKNLINDYLIPGEFRAALNMMSGNLASKKLDSLNNCRRELILESRIYYVAYHPDPCGQPVYFVVDVYNAKYDNKNIKINVELNTNICNCSKNN